MLLNIIYTHCGHAVHGLVVATIKDKSLTEETVDSGYEIAFSFELTHSQGLALGGREKERP